MKPSLAPGAALALLFASIQPGTAESCQERFVKLLVDGNGDGPVKTHVTQEIAGGGTSTNWFYWLAQDHWMTVMIEPADQAWVLAHGDVMYTSADEGKTWTKLRDMDSAQNAADANAALVENARTTRNAVCGEEELDGVMHDVVEADYTALQNFETENHFTYWVERDSGFIAKAVYVMKGNGFESLSTQIIAPEPDLTLPTPGAG